MRLWSKKQQSAIPARRRERDAARAARPSETELESRYSFRRNRTMTGSLVSEIGSASEANAQLKSPRVQAHDLRRHRRRLVWVLFGIVGISAGLFFLVWESIITPRAVMASNSTSQTTFDAHAYNETIEKYLVKHPAQRFRFSLRRDQLSEYLQTNGFPEVDSIDGEVGNDGFGIKSITVHMRRASVVWTTADTKLYVDSMGVAFARNYYDTPTVSVVDQSGIQAKGNQVLVSNRFLGFIGRLVGAIEANGYRVTQIIIPTNTTRQVEMVLGGVAYPIKLSVDRPVGEQAEDAIRAVRYFAKHNTSPRYLDIRVSGRAYYQ